MVSKSAKCICDAIGMIMLLIVVCVILVLGNAAPISVTGDAAHIKEVNQVKNSLMEVNNRINFSGVGLGSVLLLVILVILARATHHFVVKKPGKIVKRERRNQFEARMECVEGALKERGYLS